MTENENSTKHKERNSLTENFSTDSELIPTDTQEIDSTGKEGQEDNTMDMTKKITHTIVTNIQDSGQLIVDLGPLIVIKHTSHINKKGPDIEQTQLEEEENEINEHNEAHTDNNGTESDEDIGRTAATFIPKENTCDDPVTQEIEKVIEKQGLSPRGVRHIRGKKGGKSDNPELKNKGKQNIPL